MSMKFLKTIAPAALTELWEKVSGNIVPKDTSASVGIKTDDPVGSLGVGSSNEVYIASTSISAAGDADSDTGLFINYYGYNEGHTQFRDTWIANGKGTVILAVDGSEGKVGIGTGTSSPDAKAQIYTSGGGNTSGLFVGSDQGALNIWGGASSGLVFDVTSGTINDSTGTDFLLRQGGTTTIEVAADGAVTKPLQPAFQAHPASQQDNIAINTDVTIIFGTEIFDQGGDFASNTFTAPVTGKYQLNLFIRVESLDTAAPYYQPQLVTSNRTYYAPTLDPGVLASDPDYWSFSVSTLVDMDASDTAYAVFYQNGGTAQTDISTQTRFSGFLAC